MTPQQPLKKPNLRQRLSSLSSGILIGLGLLLILAELPIGAQAASDEKSQPAFPRQYDKFGVALGPKEAPIVIREFGDFQCPACRSLAPAIQKVREHYAQTDRVRFVFFDFPLTRLHPNALAAAQAARCAKQQGAYWAMHDLLYERQDHWKNREDPLPRFKRYAQKLGLDPTALEGCIREDRTLAVIKKSKAFGQAIGIHATPTVLIGNSGFRGSAPYSHLRSLIEQKLAEVENRP